MLFGLEWRAAAAAHAPADSWARDFLRTPSDAYGDGIERWLAGYPGATTQLMRRIESFRTDEHLGAVNQLACWQLMPHLGWKAEPIAEVNKSGEHRPDFGVHAPESFLLEVTTLCAPTAPRDIDTWEKVGPKIGKHFESGLDCHLSDTVRRILGKLEDTSKKGQIAYAAAQKLPLVLAVFDYSSWRFIDSRAHETLADELFGPSRTFAMLPPEVAAIAILERTFEGFVHAIDLSRSAALFNPNAARTVSQATFDAMPAYSATVSRTPARRLAPNGRVLL